MKRIMALAALFMLGGAQAALTVDLGEDSLLVAPGGSAEIPFTLSGSCADAAGPSLADILQGMGTLSHTITASGGEGLTFGTATADLDYTGCVTGMGEDPSTSGTISVTADQWAPGRIDQTVTLTDGTNSDDAEVMVNYTNLYALSTDASFPLETTDGVASFNVSLSLTTNARTMIMFFNDDAACGSITGVPPVTNVNDGDFVPGEEMTIDFEVTYTNNCSDNESDVHKFHSIAHFQDKQFGDETRYPFEWTFENGDGSASASGESEETPGFGALFAALGLVGVAFVARRK